MSVPAGWVHCQRRIAARRRERCARCGVPGNKTKLIETEAGLYCRPHADQLSPLVARYDQDLEHQATGQIDQLDRHDLEHDEDGPDAA